MKTKCLGLTLGLTLGLLASVAPLRAGEDVQLNKEFSFRLTPPELRPLAAPVPPPPPVVLIPPSPARPARRSDTLLKTPLGEPLPPGSRPFQYNGQTYYYIPL